jgi:calcineurin-like phosphoesterase/nitrate/TMAO reductase-like tetraheme cytochrome c subunit
MPARVKVTSFGTGVVVLAVLAATISVGFLRGATPSSTGNDPTQKKYKKVDPIATNGGIFEGWAKPDLALVFTGELDGYLEPCGCAGLDNQLGGLKRRFTFLKQLRDQKWPVVAVDAGDQEKRLGVQPMQKVEFAYSAYMKMGYDAVGFGGYDLNLKTDLLPILLNLNLDEKNTPLVSANVGIVDFNSGYTKRYRIIERGGLRIGVTSVAGKKEIDQKKSNPGDFVLKEPFQAIPEILANLRNAKCDHLVLLVNSTDSGEAAELATRFPEFDYVMATHGAEVPSKDFVKIPKTKANLIEVGHKGQYAVVIGFYKGGEAKYQRVPLDHRFPDAPEIHKMQEQYLHNLKRLWPQEAKASWGDLGLKMTPHPTNRKFAGTESCKDCHTNAFEVYENTPHAHAWETLASRTDPPRQFDPECISCHVTGWHPQKYFPFESGFVSSTVTPALENNGCENCHGPAAMHVAAEKGDIKADDKELERLRADLRLKVVKNEGNKDGQEFEKGKVVQLCMQCHDSDNSPDFDFQKYWPKVKHEGKD